MDSIIVSCIALGTIFLGWSFTLFQRSSIGSNTIGEWGIQIIGLVFFGVALFLSGIKARRETKMFNEQIATLRRFRESIAPPPEANGQVIRSKPDKPEEDKDATP